MHESRTCRQRFSPLAIKEMLRRYGLTSVVIAGVTAAAGATSAGVSAAQQSSSNHAEAQAATNQQVEDSQNAKQALQVAAAKEGKQRMINAAVEGTQFAAIGQRGIGVTSPSAQNVMRQTDINDQLDALNIRYQGQLTARGWGIEAQEAGTNAKIYDQNASEDLDQGYLGAGQALLSTGTNYYTGKYGTAGPYAGNGATPLSVLSGWLQP